MFIISIPKEDIPSLDGEGCNVRINGDETVLRRDGEYLCYPNNRCLIIDEHSDGHLVHFIAASDGQDDVPHDLVRLAHGDPHQYPGGDGTSLGVQSPMPQYHMSRSVVADWLRESARTYEQVEGQQMLAAETWANAESTEWLEGFSRMVEDFANEHSLWAVPSHAIIDLFLNHVQQSLATEWECEGCGAKIGAYLNGSAAVSQIVRTSCPSCQRTHVVEITVENGQPSVEIRMEEELSDDR